MASLSRALVSGGIIAALVLFAGCSASTDGDGEAAPTTATTPTPTAEESGPSTYEPLSIPSVTDDELGRTVFVLDGPEGAPSTTTTLFASPEPGLPYVLEGRCVPDDAALTVSYTIFSTGDPQVELASGPVTCDGTEFREVMMIDTDTPPQVNFVRMDGVNAAYLRIVGENAD